MIREVMTLPRLLAMTPEEAAALWLVRSAEGELPHEKDLFEQWLEHSPANRDAWERAQHGWNLFEGADGDELLDAMRLHARSAAPTGTERRTQFAAAAALLLVVATGTMVANRTGLFGTGEPTVAGSSGSPQPSAATASVQYANDRDLPKLVTLPDGSRMTLDAETRVAASFGPRQRSLQLLSGRAFFAVQHNPARAFVVQARNVVVTAIGTQFDVRMAQRDVRVALVEGRLSVRAGGADREPLLMSAGEQLIAPDAGAPRLTRADDDEAVNWQQGYARFDDESLAEASAVLNRYPGDRLVIRDSRVAALRISGNFKVGDPERFGRTLEQIYPVRVVRRSGNELEIVPAG